MTDGIQHPTNQLDRVICQIRFPALLEIDGMIAEYQKKVRDQYPSYSRSSTLQMNLANAPLPTDHTFQSEDGAWSITLSVSALSLTTTRYSDWAGFRCRLERAISAALGIFDIETCSRTGLRYINAIRPSSIGLPDPKSALRPPYSDMMSCDIGTIAGVNTVVDYLVEGDVRGRSMIGMIQFMDGELGVMIDNDAFVEEGVPVGSLLATLDRLNSCSLETFRRIASDELISKVIP